MSEPGFVHGASVPQIFRTAAKIAREVRENGKGLKDLVYREQKQRIKPLFGLVCEALKHGPQLDAIIRKSNILVENPRLDPWMTRILIADLLWGKKKLTRRSKPEQIILSYEQKFQEISKDELPLTITNNQKVGKHRVVRINTILLSVQDAIAGFREEEWVFVPRPAGGYAEFLVALQNLDERQFMADFHIPELLIFPAGTVFYNHRAYKSGQLVLQDKASCLPPFLLAPEPGSSILDMCAAPGMKTSQLAAILDNNGSIVAVERNQGRYKTLQKFIRTTNSKCVQAVNRDVITLTKKDCPDVEYILVDPSCSGSGMVDRIDVDEPEVKTNKERLEKLASFQILILRHALTSFPKVKRVVYSTCSIFPEENEQVVQAVLGYTQKFKLVCVKDLLNGQWFNLGSDEYENIGPNCIYAKPDKDLSNGFFVAVFERCAPAEESDIVRKEVVKKRKFESKKEEDSEEKPMKMKCKKSKNKDTPVEGIQEVAEVVEENAEDNIVISPMKKKCKKSKNKDTPVEDIQEEAEVIEENAEDNIIISPMKKKCKKSKNKDTPVEDIQEEAEVIEENAEDNIVIPPKKKKAKKNKKNKDIEQTDEI